MEGPERRKMLGNKGKGAGAVARKDAAGKAPHPLLKEARGQRRRRETRWRLLRAAYELMADRGRAGVAINEITEAADVGFGSFYNHFESKDDIHAAVVEEVFSRFGEALSQIAEVLDDPAEILAASLRYVMERARREPRWGRFLIRSAFSMQNMSQGMGRYLMQDLQRGIDAGRFRTEDLMMTLLTIGGVVVATINAEFELNADADIHQLPGFDTEGLAERVVAWVLRQLGLKDEEAREIAQRPLPAMSLELGI